MKILAMLLLCACAPLSTIGTHRDGVGLCTRKNIYPYELQVYLQDDRGHEKWVGFIRTGGQFCTQWPFTPQTKGRWGYQQGGEPIRWDQFYFDVWAMERGFHS